MFEADCNTPSIKIFCSTFDTLSQVPNKLKDESFRYFLKPKFQLVCLKNPLSSTESQKKKNLSLIRENSLLISQSVIIIFSLSFLPRQSSIACLVPIVSRVSNFLVVSKNLRAIAAYLTLAPNSCVRREVRDTVRTRIIQAQ